MEDYFRFWRENCYRDASFWSGNTERAGNLFDKVQATFEVSSAIRFDASWAIHQKHQINPRATTLS